MRRRVGENAREDDVPIAQPDDVDADGICGAGVLAHRARSQAPPRSEEGDLEEEDEDDHRHRDRPLFEHLDRRTDRF